MNKKILVFAGIGFALIAVCFVLTQTLWAPAPVIDDSTEPTEFIDPAKPTVGQFSIWDYGYHMSNFSRSINVGSVTSADEAIEKTKKLLPEVYPNSFSPEAMNSYYGYYTVSYDSFNPCWLVEYTSDYRAMGVSVHVLIDADGTVLAVFYE